jgi:hypothetical protein
MDITETLATEKEAIKNGHFRDTGNRKRGNQEWTLQRHWQQKKRQSRMDITETLATEKEAIKNGHYRDTGKKKEAIKNGHYRDTGNIVLTRHRTKKNKTQNYNTTQKTKKMSNTDLTKNHW